MQQCPYCEGKRKILSSESVARNVEKEIRKYFTQTIASAIEVEVHPSVAEVLLGKMTNLSELKMPLIKEL